MTPTKTARLPASMAFACALGLTLAACGGEDAGETSDFSAATSSRPVRLAALDTGNEACPDTGMIGAAEPVDVRGYPGPNGAVAGTIAPETPVFVCERETASQWYGIIYPTVDADAETGSGDAATMLTGCDLPNSAGAGNVYDGNCNAGWVPASSVTLQTGDDG